MINRENFKLTRRYLKYLDAHQKRATRTIESDRRYLRHLLEWADATLFYNAPKLEPIYPRYLGLLGLKGSTITRYCQVARGFFTWLRRAEPKRTRRITDLWMETLTPGKAGRSNVTHDGYTLDEIRLLCDTPENGSLTITRAKATAALLFVSGMRGGALVTLPIECLDLAGREVRQWIERGVETKGDVSATTYLLDIPDLIEIAQEWDDIVRAQLPPSAAWFAPLTSDGMALAGDAPGARGRVGRLGSGLKMLCKLAGVRYRNPHCIRHGHAAYAMKRCKNIADYKAVSMNLMHADITTTDRIYSTMLDAEIKQRIAGLLEGGIDGEN